MKDHELLNMIGEVNEDYVLEAGSNVTRPRFRWKTLAACAACVALVLAAYPVYRASHPALHSYTVMEGDAMTTLNGQKAPAGGGTSTMPGGAYVGGDKGETGVDGTYYYHIPGQDAPDQEYAIDQYDKLLRGMGMHGEGASAYPDWFAGAWIDWESLHVAIVDGMRTPEREEEITGWCGDGVVFESAKYSHSFLDGLMDPATDIVVNDGNVGACGIGVDVAANCLGIDLYGDGEEIPNSVLAALARLDPDGDAIRVRVFTQSMSTLTDEVKKGPAPGGKTAPVFDGARAEPRVEDSRPAGAFGGINELPEEKYDALKKADRQSAAGYDIIEGE